MQNYIEYIFVVDIILLYALLLGVVWSIVLPQKRIWPPPGKQSWQYRLVWICFYLIFFFNALLLVYDWNKLIFMDFTRHILGVPLIIVGTLFVSWGIYILGISNTSGQRDGFVAAGPYRYTRNPQYLGDILLFLGLSLVANSLYLWIAHSLLILVFLLTPMTEEGWLADQYGEDYQDYKRMVPRFF